jgi:hypothetical protein
MRVEGTAQNAKLSAAVVNGEQVVYCLNRTDWPVGVEGKRVMVEGEVSQGTEGGDIVIRNCTCWLEGPRIVQVHELFDWLQKNGTSAQGERLRFRLPIVAFFEGPQRLGISRAFVAVSSEVSGKLAVTLDDGALGIPLLERLRELCPGSHTSCAVWLEGYWGALIEDPSDGNGAASQRTFAVLKVLTPIDRAMGGALNVFVEAP